jgi:hypothetical protein
MPNTTDEDLKRLAEIRSVAQQQLFHSVADAARLSKQLWAVFIAIVTALVYVTAWFVHINATTDSNTRHIRVLWVNKYGVEP